MANITTWEQDLAEVIKRGSDIKTDYKEYSKCYPFTNEKLKDLLELIEKTYIKNALCVLSSGDHAFNLIYHGINNIDTFDCNKVTEYYALGFKKTAIECLTYQQFLDFFFKGSLESQNIEKYIISCMSGKYKNFWQGYQDYVEYLMSNPQGASIFEKYFLDSGKANIFRLLAYIEESMQTNNNYLASEQDYRQLQKNLLNAQINFNYMNIKSIYRQKEKYDLIMLSNVLQAMKKPFFGKTISIAPKIYKHNLNDKGELLYLYEFLDMEALGKTEIVCEKTAYEQELKYLLNGSSAVSKKKVMRKP